MEFISVVTFFLSLAMCSAHESDRSSHSPPYTCTTTTTLCQDGVDAGHPIVPSSHNPSRPRRGPVGPPGLKGDKGDPCQCDMADEREISQLRGEVAALRERLENAEVTEGWLRGPNGYLYLFHSGFITGGWSAAREFCQREGGDIAMVGMRDAVTERFLMRNFLDGFGQVSYWIGLTDIEQEGTWKWADGVSADQEHTNWLPGQPSNSGGAEHCAQLFGSSSFKWNDDSCSKPLGVVCEKKG